MKDIRVLSKHQLVHLLEELHEPEEIEEGIKRQILGQRAMTMLCWDCSELASKLDIIV